VQSILNSRYSRYFRYRFFIFCPPSKRGRGIKKHHHRGKNFVIGCGGSAPGRARAEDGPMVRDHHESAYTLNTNNTQMFLREVRIAN
jgi:hypothetical protein